MIIYLYVVCTSTKWKFTPTFQMHLSRTDWCASAKVIWQIDR